MTSPGPAPVRDEGPVEPPGSDTSAPEPVTGGPSRNMRGKSASELRRLSPISERDPENPSSQDALGGSSERGGSSFSTCSDRMKSSSRVSSDESHPPDTADDCAALLLACLHCRFQELITVLLPDTCERAVSRCFPSYKYVRAWSEREQQESDCCSCKVDVDCNVCSCCQDAGELIELAMEISEVCYR